MPGCAVVAVDDVAEARDVDPRGRLARAPGQDEQVGGDKELNLPRRRDLNAAAPAAAAVGRREQAAACGQDVHEPIDRRMGGDGRESVGGAVALGLIEDGGPVHAAVVAAKYRAG